MEWHDRELELAALYLGIDVLEDLRGVWAGDPDTPKAICRNRRSRNHGWSGKSAPPNFERVKLTNNECLGTLDVSAHLALEIHAMKTMTVGEFKSRFSEALDAVRDGETIIVSYGRNRRKVAAMVPFSDLKSPRQRPLGLLKATVRVKFGRDFALTDDEFLEA